MKKIIRNSMLALALLTNTAVAQEAPCVYPCEGDGDGGSCSNTELEGTERFHHIVAIPPNGSATCYEKGRRIQVACRDSDGNTLSNVTVTYWTGELRCVVS